jgi:hypothetical protein
MMSKPIHSLLDRFIEQFAALIVARAEQLSARSAAARGVRTAVIRICPYLGCKNPGAGPRNRWFCREHAISVPFREQKRILAERAEANKGAVRITRAAAPVRHLDMRCRVGGCKNSSRGPRLGYICDKHRSELSAKEQREAREKWNASRADAARSLPPSAAK